MSDRVDWERKLAPLLDEAGAELLETQVSKGRTAWRLRFFVDREAGIGVDDLARLSRRISLLLDADPVLAGRYELEVSSPGMNRVVRSEPHFQRFRGERVHVWTHRRMLDRDYFEGTILACANGHVSVEVDQLGVLEFPLADIRRAELRLDPRRRPQPSPNAEGEAKGSKNGE